jgi:hypothetical protein
VVAVVGLTLAGCTNTDPGQPVAAGQSGFPSGAGQTSVAIPPRPKEIKLDGLDPCRIMTKAQLDQIKIERQRNQTIADGRWKGVTHCAMDGGDGKKFWDYDLNLVTVEGIEPYANGKRNVDAKLVSVGGFAAVDYKGIGTTNVDCTTAVDVASGQQLVMNFKPDRNMFTQDQMCQKSEQAAGLALQALQTPK